MLSKTSKSSNPKLQTLNPKPAQVSTKVNDMLSKTSKSGALKAFEAMEEKVDKLEAEAEVSLELSGADVSLNDTFKKMEASSKVDDDLAALKGMIGGSKSETKILEAEVKRDPKVEEEMKK